jgi:hypothetical protein
MLWAWGLLLGLAGLLNGCQLFPVPDEMDDRIPARYVTLALVCSQNEVPQRYSPHSSGILAP